MPENIFSELTAKGGRLTEQPVREGSELIANAEALKVPETASERIDFFLKYKKKEWHEQQLKEKRKLRKLPKWQKNMPAEAFLRIIRFMPFHLIFSRYATINR